MATGASAMVLRIQPAPLFPSHRRLVRRATDSCNPIIQVRFRRIVTNQDLHVLRRWFFGGVGRAAKN